MSKLSRRKFLFLGAGSTLASSAFAVWLTRQQAAAQNAALGQAPVAPKLDAVPKAPAPAKPLQAKQTKPAPGGLPTRLLGRTGQRVSIFGLGGASSQTPLSNGPHEAAVSIVERALALGVSYFDTASSYGDGKSERAIGEVAKTQRARMTIASKPASAPTTARCANSKCRSKTCKPTISMCG